MKEYLCCIIVQIFYVALFVIPVLVIPAINWLGVTLANIGILPAENAMAMLINREFSFTARGIVALAISYGAFSSEIFRAGIQSIEKGQIEAARAVQQVVGQRFVTAQSSHQVADPGLPAFYQLREGFAVAGARQRDQQRLRAVGVEVLCLAHAGRSPIQYLSSWEDSSGSYQRLAT